MFFVLAIILFLPKPSLGLSPSELEALADSGSKSVTKSDWRRSFSLSLSRGLDFKTGHLALEYGDSSKISSWWECDPTNADSLCDPYSIYYHMGLTLYYSLKTLGQTIQAPDFFKKTELFVNVGFRSNFAGGELRYFNLQKPPSYIEGGLRDIIIGWTNPVYQKESFSSFFDFSAMVVPLSLESSENYGTGLKRALEGDFNWLYSIKKTDKQQWLIEASHILNYNYFTKATKDGTGKSGYNMPLVTVQTFRLVGVQNFNRYLPSNSKLFISYTFGLNKHFPKSCNKEGAMGRLFSCGDHEHWLALGALSSWKVQKNFFISLSARWRDLIRLSNPLDEKVQESVSWSLALHNWYLSLTGSYTF